MRGKFLVIYGANNIGKSTQIKLLSSHLVNAGKQVLSIKYPLYQLEPTGPIIHKALRSPEKLNREYNNQELQQVYAQNRRDFEPTLLSCLEAGINVVAEDYIGTGLAWGLTYGVGMDDLLKYNKKLVQPDSEILLDGERLHSGIEEGHRHEAAGDKIWQKNREIHQKLAAEFNWKIVQANQTMEQVHKDIVAELPRI